MKKPLKLYVWTNYCPDYTGGLACSIASSEAEAKHLVIANQGYDPIDTWGDLTIYSLTRKMAASVSGGS